MNNIDLEEKTYTTHRKRVFPFFSVGLIIVGTAMLVGGGIFYDQAEASEHNIGKVISVSDNFELGKASSVKIDAGAGKLDIRPSSDDRIHIEGNVPEDYVIKENDGILLVDLTQNWNFHFNFNAFDIGSSTVDAILYLPEIEYEELYLEVGAGEITVTDIKCREASIDSGAGEITVNGLTAKGLVRTDIGAGEITITKAVTGGLDVDIGAGEFTYTGEVNGDIDVDCGAGDCNIALTNDQDEFYKKYSVDTDSGVGDIKVTFNNK
ncbi:DUF4097 family beta strand repeat-containing protein [Ruminococcus albus]|uniref:Putative adhesin n=1 Tax=Ruminococcus albus TaxID=1264 RepID=A0A1H7GY98_RUMAL|nr:DUF4097 family beta strand repeat-containing protein [Ruminococcus albus]SEK42032.1 Putative adhesin [Ruminococcus albus]